MSLRSVCAPWECMTSELYGSSVHSGAEHTARKRASLASWSSCAGRTNWKAKINTPTSQLYNTLQGGAVWSKILKAEQDEEMGVGLCADQSDMVSFELKGKRRCETSPRDSREDCSRQGETMEHLLWERCLFWE